MTRENRLIRGTGPEEQNVATTDGATAPHPDEAEPARKRTRRRPRHGGPYPGKRQVTAYIDRALFLWLKSISAQTDLPMVEIFETALSDYVNQFKARQSFGAR